MRWSRKQVESRKDEVEVEDEVENPEDEVEKITILGAGQCSSMEYGWKVRIVGNTST
jgi:hypothetical protein